MENIQVHYSTKAKAHELVMLKLKSENLSEISTSEITKKYLEMYDEAFSVLEQDRVQKIKLKRGF
ncbi:hypothetical protein [Clostridium sp. YIM B02506]|uniref:hypothetical protein n=1 Tax=Clostridium sp. YIM B02506 TaxID=2910680 RepID=UPI001EEEA000|nr:hypothetical protein [Clostridium sp. YIM B02506]